MDRETGVVAVLARAENGHNSGFAEEERGTFAGEESRTFVGEERGTFAGEEIT